MMMVDRSARLAHITAVLEQLNPDVYLIGTGPSTVGIIPLSVDEVTAPQTLKLPSRGDLAVAIVRSILARAEANSTIERCCDVFEQTYRQNREVAMAGYGRLWKLKPGDYAPPKRNGVFAEMDRLRNG